MKPKGEQIVCLESAFRLVFSKAHVTCLYSSFDSLLTTKVCFVCYTTHECTHRFTIVDEVVKWRLLPKPQAHSRLLSRINSLGK